MHEYGHTFDSHNYGLAYLFAVGVPSLISAAGASPIDREPFGVTTHDFKPYEMRANRHASRYFSKYYGVDWSIYETTHPRNNRKH